MMKYQCEKCGFTNYVIKKSRSLNENNYLHGVVLPLLCDYTGYTADEMKLFLKKKFGWVETKKVIDQIIEIPVSTASMSTSDFEKFMTQIRMFGDTLGVYIPEPNEPYAINQKS